MASTKDRLAFPPPAQVKTRLLPHEEKLARLRLIRSGNIGPVTFRELLRCFGSGVAALEALPGLAARGGRAVHHICTASEAGRELEEARRLGAKLMAVGEPGYPPLLAQLEAPPPLIYIKGRAEILSQPAVALVGSRNASASGQKFARHLAAELGGHGYVIASGLARGIDTAAHHGALATGTVAILAGGIDMIYPPENAALYDAIGERGALITECPPGFAPRGQDFPRRNRLISGISLGVIVVEAAMRSGSLITARFALEQNREIFAIPGHPLDPRAEGANDLLKKGAALVTKAEDVVRALAPLSGAMDDFRSFAPAAAAATPPEETGEAAVIPAGDATGRETLIGALGYSPVSIDDLIRQTGLSSRTVSICLLELDLAGRLERHGGQLISLK